MYLEKVVIKKGRQRSQRFLETLTGTLFNYKLWYIINPLRESLKDILEILFSSLKQTTFIIFRTQGRYQKSITGPRVTEKKRSGILYHLSLVMSLELKKEKFIIGRDIDQ